MAAPSPLNREIRIRFRMMLAMALQMVMVVTDLYFFAPKLKDQSRLIKTCSGIHKLSIKNCQALVSPYLPLVSRVTTGTHKILSAKGISMIKHISALLNE